MLMWKSSTVIVQYKSADKSLLFLVSWSSVAAEQGCGVYIEMASETLLNFHFHNIK